MWGRETCGEDRDNFCQDYGENFLPTDLQSFTCLLKKGIYSLVMRELSVRAGYEQNQLSDS